MGDPIRDLIIGIAGKEINKTLDKQLVVPSADLPKLAGKMKARLKKNGADPALQNLTDAQLISLVKAADQELIDYVEERLGV